MSALTLDEIPVRSHLSDFATDQLKAANYFLRTALDQMNDGLMILQPDALEGLGPKILFSNAKMIALVGADPKTGLKDRFVTQLVASQDDAEKLLSTIRSASKNGGSATWEGEVIKLHGAGPQLTSWRIRAVQNSHGQVLNYTVNVSESADLLMPTNEPEDRLSLMEEVTEKDEARRLRNDNLAAMAKGIVHDINNLVGIISGHLSVAATQIPAHTEVGRHLEEALLATQRARQFTSQILRLAKDLPAKLDLHDLTILVRETAKVAQSGSGVLIHLNMAKDLWWAMVDATKISQVLQNLILNGIQAMQSTGHMDIVARNVEVQQQSGKLAPGKYVEICVRDRGCGMSQDHLARLFRESFTTKPDGNGIGLTSCKRFIDEHNGDIRVSSMKNIGTEFTFYLPASAGTIEVKPPVQSNTLMQGVGTVLVCDDEIGLRKISAAILKRCGYKVYEAASGEEAVRIYQHLMRSGDEVDVVIMDLTLRGGIGGEEALREIRMIDPNAQIIASSGDLVDETKRGYLAMGFADILPKPYEAQDISSAVYRVLNTRTRTAEKRSAA